MIVSCKNAPHVKHFLNVYANWVNFRKNRLLTIAAGALVLEVYVKTADGSLVGQYTCNLNKDDEGPQ